MVRHVALGHRSNSHLIPCRTLSHILPITSRVVERGNHRAHQRYNRQLEIKGEPVMAQKIIEVVGTSKESFAKAAENAVAKAAETVRGLRWARVAELEMELDGHKIAEYRATTKVYFDIEK